MPHLLVVDDDQDILTLLGSFLQKHHYQVSTAETGETMFAILDRQPVDLVILDIMLRNEDGSSLCQRLITGIFHPPITQTLGPFRHQGLPTLIPLLCLPTRQGVFPHAPITPCRQTALAPARPGCAHPDRADPVSYFQWRPAGPCLAMPPGLFTLLAFGPLAKQGTINLPEATGGLPLEQRSCGTGA